MLWNNYIRASLVLLVQIQSAQGNYNGVSDAKSGSSGNTMSLMGKFGCTEHSECTVKNVGNCCGYYPECVNINYEPDPEAVQAACIANGITGIICEPTVLKSCECTMSKCKAVHDDVVQHPAKTMPPLDDLGYNIEATGFGSLSEAQSHNDEASSGLVGTTVQQLSAWSYLLLPVFWGML